MKTYKEMLRDECLELLRDIDAMELHMVDPIRIEQVRREYNANAAILRAIEERRNIQCSPS
jgi:hypothetical protein